MENHESLNLEGLRDQSNTLRVLRMQDSLLQFAAAGAQVCRPELNPCYDFVVPQQMNTRHVRSLEAQFGALNLSDATNPAMLPQDHGACVFPGGDIPVSFHGLIDLSHTSSLQKLRAHSAANGNVGLFIRSQNYPTYENLGNPSDPVSVLNGHCNPIPVFGFDPNEDSHMKWYPNFERGNFLNTAKDQFGCRLLQKKFLQGTPEEKDMIFSELQYHVCDLMVHRFGNHLIQTIFDACTVKQMDRLLSLVTDNAVDLFHVCVDIHGGKAMQKMLENLTTREQKSHLLSVLGRLVVHLAKSKIGQHVIHHCLKSFSRDETKHLLNEIASHCVEIATDQDGCRVLKQCVSLAPEELQDRLMAEIAANSVILSEHAYGNYVIQYLVELRIPHVTSNVLARLAGNFVALSLNKHGSHVVENCMRHSGGDQLTEIVQEIISSPRFLTVLQDPFGNFVAQSALQLCKGSFVHKNMVTLILDNYPYLHSHPYGQKVLAKVRGSKTVRDHAKYIQRLNRMLCI